MYTLGELVDCELCLTKAVRDKKKWITDWDRQGGEGTGRKKEAGAVGKMMVVAGPCDREVERLRSGQALRSFDRPIHLLVCTFY